MHVGESRRQVALAQQRLEDAVRGHDQGGGCGRKRQEADIARAQARLENSRFTQTRARDLLDRGIISRREMEDADRDVADAQADVARAEAARTAADASMARATIRAPFAGIIAQRLHNPGDVVQGIIPAHPLPLTRASAGPGRP